MGCEREEAERETKACARGPAHLIGLLGAHSDSQGVWRVVAIIVSLVVARVIQPGDDVEARVVRRCVYATIFSGTSKNDDGRIMSPRERINTSTKATQHPKVQLGSTPICFHDITVQKPLRIG